MGTFQKIIKNEEGFWSIVFLLLLTTLASLGMATYHAVKQSSSNAVNQTLAVQADYTATSGIYYGVERAMAGIVDSTEVVTIEGATVTIENTQLAADSIEVISTSNMNGAERSIRVLITVPSDFTKNAVTTEGTIGRGVHALDSTGTEDPSLLVSNTPIPTFDDDSLKTLATGQGRYYNGLTVNSTFPVGATSFWLDSLAQIPYYTYVNGTMTVKTGCDIYGIFVVDNGNVELNNKVNVYGVIYVVDDENMVMRGKDTASNATVTGGVVSRGNVVAASKRANDRQFVRHKPSYLKFFAGFASNFSANFKHISWEYL